MALVRLCPGYRSMGPMLTAPMVGEMTTKNCVSQCQHAITLRAILRRTEIKAHSPLYSTKIGRVLSKNAGDASMAVAIPALIAYFMSCCFMRAPNAHSDCFTRPMNVRFSRAGVWIVFGACGVTFGNDTALWGLCCVK